MNEVSQLEQKLSQKLEENLQILNPSYQLGRSIKVIGEAKVWLVKSGTFLNAVKLLVTQGVPEAQIKIPRYTRKPELIKLLEKNRLIK